jgi:hypothetical protein
MSSSKIVTLTYIVLSLIVLAFVGWVLWETHECKQKYCPPGTHHSVVLLDGCYCSAPAGEVP